MILGVESNAAHSVASEARSRAGSCHCLSTKDGTLFNEPVLILAKVIKNVMASAAKSEIGALHMNGQEAAGVQNALTAMGCPQPAPTPMKTDDSAANDIINNAMKQERSKALHMHFCQIQDVVKQGQFHIFWDTGESNLANCHDTHI